MYDSPEYLERDAPSACGEWVVVAAAAVAVAAVLVLAATRVC